MAALLREEMPADTESKQRMLARHKVALWDVIARCDITGSSDLSIKNALVNPIAGIVSGRSIAAIFLNGSTAAMSTRKAAPKPEIPAIALPSTSAANAAAPAPADSGLGRCFGIL